jgi:hypothetical protein
MSAGLSARRAETLVLWYRDQPNHGTWLTDAEVAMALHRAAPGEGWAGPHAPNGNGDLVRSTRRWVDRQRDGDFGELIFGTRSNGGRRGFSHLRDGRARLRETEDGAQAQVARSEQRRRAQAEERAREAMKLEAQANSFAALGQYRKAFVCHDGANEVEKFGEIQEPTRLAMEQLGLL